MACAVSGARLGESAIHEIWRLRIEGRAKLPQKQLPHWISLRDNSPYAYTMSERLAPQEERVTLVTNVRLVCDVTRPVTSQQPTVGNVTAVDWKPVNP